MPNNLGNGTLVDFSKTSNNVVGSNTMEDVMDGFEDVSSTADHSAVSSHHVSIMVSDEARFSHNMEHLVDHGFVMSGSVVNDGVELMDKLVVVDGSVDAGHVEGSFEVTF